MRRLTDGVLRVLDLRFEHFRRVARRVDDDEVALIPRRVVPDVVLQKTLHKRHLVLP